MISLGTLRNVHWDFLARPGRIAVSVRMGNWRPVSDASSTVFWKMPYMAAAAPEHVGPMPTSASVCDSTLRATEMAWSALQAES